jgi:outer membrane protein assembly factor BamB
VVALDPATGAVRWTHLTPGFVLAAPTVAGEVVAVVSNASVGGKSTLELLDARTGAALRSFEDPSATFASPVVSRGQVLWVTFEGRLVALGK